MKNLIILVVLAGVGFGAFKLLVKKETEAYKTYCKFADALAKTQFVTCQEMAEGAEALSQINLANIANKRAILRRNFLGSECEFESETPGKDAKEVTVKMTQNFNYSVGNQATAFGYWRKIRHTARMVRVGDQWKVASFTAEEEKEEEKKK